MTDTPFAIDIRVYYEDTDFSGIVYHANYLKFFERGRTDALRACGLTHTELLARDEPLAFSVRSMTIDWRSPARIDDLLRVETRFVSAAGARMRLRQEILKDGAVLAGAEVEAACMGLTGRPRRLPADIRALLAPHLAPHAEPNQAGGTA
ncbi:MAG: tol-pal system-associated acyl-CoA thioesterase [Pseudomonadota bacterium]